MYFVYKNIFVSHFPSFQLLPSSSSLGSSQYVGACPHHSQTHGNWSRGGGFLKSSCLTVECGTCLLALRLLSILGQQNLHSDTHPKSGLCIFTHCSTHSRTFSRSVIHWWSDLKYSGEWEGQGHITTGMTSEGFPWERGSLSYCLFLIHFSDHQQAPNS